MASDWNSTVHFGMGKQRADGVTGFHGQGNGSVFSGVVYRGDTRSPNGGIFSKGPFQTGFTLHKAGVETAGRTTSATAQVNEAKGTTRGVVSGSTSIKTSAYWAIHNTAEEGWLYCMYVENESWAAEATMNLMGTAGEDAARAQREIMFRELPASCIYAARKVKRTGPVGAKQAYLVGKLIANPGYRGTNPYGIAFKDDDFKILIDAGPQVLCE